MKKVWIASAVFLALLAGVAYADVRGGISLAFNQMTNFFNGGYEAHAKMIDFFLFFVIFTSIYMLGLNKWFGGKYSSSGGSNAVKTLAVALGLISTFAMMKYTEYAFTIFYPYAKNLIFFLCAIMVYMIITKLGPNLNKFVAGVMAFIITWLLFNAGSCLIYEYNDPAKNECNIFGVRNLMPDVGGWGAYSSGVKWYEGPYKKAWPEPVRYEPEPRDEPEKPWYEWEIVDTLEGTFAVGEDRFFSYEGANSGQYVPDMKDRIQKFARNCEGKVSIVSAASAEWKHVPPGKTKNEMNQQLSDKRWNKVLNLVAPLANVANTKATGSLGPEGKETEPDRWKHRRFRLECHEKKRRPKEVTKEPEKESPEETFPSVSIKVTDSRYSEIAQQREIISNLRELEQRDHREDQEAARRIRENLLKTEVIVKDPETREVLGSFDVDMWDNKRDIPPIEEGEYLFEVRRPFYKPYEKKIDVKDGELISIQLEPMSDEARKEMYDDLNIDERMKDNFDMMKDLKEEIAGINEDIEDLRVEQGVSTLKEQAELDAMRQRWASMPESEEKDELWEDYLDRRKEYEEDMADYDEEVQGKERKVDLKTSTMRSLYDKNNELRRQKKHYLLLDEFEKLWEIDFREDKAERDMLEEAERQQEVLEESHPLYQTALEESFQDRIIIAELNEEGRDELMKHAILAEEGDGDIKKKSREWLEHNEGLLYIQPDRSPEEIQEDYGNDEKFRKLQELMRGKEIPKDERDDIFRLWYYHKEKVDSPSQRKALENRFRGILKDNGIEDEEAIGEALGKGELREKTLRELREKDTFEEKLQVLEDHYGASGVEVPDDMESIKQELGEKDVRDMEADLKSKGITNPEVKEELYMWRYLFQKTDNEEIRDAVGHDMQEHSDSFEAMKGLTEMLLEEGKQEGAKGEPEESESVDPQGTIDVESDGSKQKDMDDPSKTAEVSASLYTGSGTSGDMQDPDNEPVYLEMRGLDESKTYTAAIKTDGQMVAEDTASGAQSKKMMFNLGQHAKTLKDTGSLPLSYTVLEGSTEVASGSKTLTYGDQAEAAEVSARLFTDSDDDSSDGLSVMDLGESIKLEVKGTNNQPHLITLEIARKKYGPVEIDKDSTLPFNIPSDVQGMADSALESIPISYTIKDKSQDTVASGSSTLTVGSGKESAGEPTITAAPADGGTVIAVSVSEIPPNTEVELVTELLDADGKTLGEQNWGTAKPKDGKISDIGHTEGTDGDYDRIRVKILYVGQSKEFEKLIQLQKGQPTTDCTEQHLDSLSDKQRLAQLQKCIEMGLVKIEAES